MSRADKLPLNQERPCAVCGSYGKEAIYYQRFGSFSRGTLLEGYQVVACSDCGFCFADGIPAQVLFDAYYTEMSKYEYQESDGHESPCDLARFQDLLAFLKPYLPELKARIFEIGCSTGTLLSLLKKAGYQNLAGIDPSPACVATAQRVHGIQITPSTLAELTLPANSADFLIMVGVLEHIRDLQQCLTKLWHILAPGGCLFICVPNASRYCAGEDAPFQEFSVEHINFFGPDSLRNLLSSTGFAEVSCHETMIQTNHRTYTPAIQSIFEKNLKVPATVSFSHDNRTVAELSAYIEKSQEIDRRLQAIIEEIIFQGQPIIIWGAGTHTQRLLAATSLSKANILAFVDSNPKFHGKSISGLPIISPQELRSWPNHPILISSRAFQKEISATILKVLRLKNNIITLYELDAPGPSASY